MGDCDSAYEETNRILKIQRHDFLNHLQVIHSLIQLGKTDKALKYIQEISQSDDLLKPLSQFNKETSHK